MLFRTDGVISAAWLADVVRLYARRAARAFFAVLLLPVGVSIWMLWSGAWAPGVFAAAMTIGALVRILQTPNRTSAEAKRRFAVQHGNGPVTLTVWFTEDRMVQQYSDGCEVSFALDQVRRVDDLGPVWVVTMRRRALAILFADRLSRDEQQQLIQRLRDNAPHAHLPVR